MTPQEEALQQQVSNLPVFKEVINDLEGLRKGQEALGVYVAEGFTKGKDRMDGIEDMFKDHINTTKENHVEAMNNLSDLKTEIKDNKLKDVTDELRQKNSEIQAIKDKTWGAVKMILNGIISVIVGGLIVYFFK